MATSNTIIAHHFSVRNGEIKINPKDYYWHIPKKLRTLIINPGNVVRVQCKESEVLVIVTKVFREDIEITGKKYKSVITKISHPQRKKPKKSLKKLAERADGVIKPLKEALIIMRDLKEK